MSKAIGNIFALGLAPEPNDEEKERLEQLSRQTLPYLQSAKSLEGEDFRNSADKYLRILENAKGDNNQSNYNFAKPTTAFTENNVQYAQLADTNIATDAINQSNGNNSVDEIFNRVFAKTLEEEGGFEYRPEKIDTPTNMGFQQATLDKFRELHPDISEGYPERIEDLTYEQGRQIARKDYFDKYRIGEIKYEPLQETMFDSFFNHSPYAPALWAQKALNQNTNASVDEDGIFGSQTINALNSLSEENMIRVNNSIIDQREADYEEEKKRNRNRFYNSYTRGLPARFNRFRVK